MAMTAMSDMSRHFLTLGNNNRIRSDLDKLTQEMSSGQANDLTQHLRHDTQRLSDIDRHLSLIKSFSSAAREVGQSLTVMQLALTEVERTRDSIVSQVITITEDSDAAAFSQAGVSARQGLVTVIGSLNSRLGDIFLFSGNTPGQAPMLSANEIMTRLETAVAGVTTAADITTIVDTWFDDPAGGFATEAYLGDTGPLSTRRVDPATNITLEPRADDPVLRDLIKGMALLSIANMPNSALDIETRAALTRDGVMKLIGRGSAMIALQGHLGQAEATVDQAMARQSGEKVALEIMRNNLVLVDPFDTSTALTAVEKQLEIHFTLTARLSRLSLADYLR